MAVVTKDNDYVEQGHLYKDVCTLQQAFEAFVEAYSEIYADDWDKNWGEEENEALEAIERIFNNGFTIG